MGLDNEKLKVELNVGDLSKFGYWIVTKFQIDNFHQQHNSSRSDLIGGFFDRWINRIPEFLIFNKLLETKNYEVVNDMFLYSQDTEKNAPDILGLKDCLGEYYPFSVFNDGEWEHIENMPFIEMKTFRKSQKLITIPENQFDESHFYVIVESHIREDYLISLFDDKFYSKDNFENIKKINKFIKSDFNSQLKNPTELKKLEELGYYELLGIYKGSELSKFSILVGETNGNADKPRYIKTINPKEDIKNKDNKLLNDGINFHQKEEGENNVPFNVELIDKGKIIIYNSGKTYIDIKVNGKAKIDGNLLQDNFYRLNFAKFERSSKKKEVILSKDAIASSYNSSINDLINKFDNIVK